MSPERYICIHGHFYQPARHNTWLEYVEQQETAHPYHDWNERVTAECYAPNTASRILDEKGDIIKIVSNYDKISFNFGPTLLAWLEENAPEIYSAILAADRESQRAFYGHGSAMAQAYHHMILPLANSRDKYTQVLWGIRDFEHRFGRKPEGMWLPEMAIDLETMGILARLGIKFTILAPRQAKRVRQIGSNTWQDVSGGKIDPRLAYELSLPSGHKIALFFYDDAIARDVAFGGLLSNGENFAQRLAGALAREDGAPRLVHIATDGETYGHHHRFGDMALAYALNYIESNNLARITNYAEFLEKHPPRHRVEIIENTSWSCAHGVERWRSNCGDNSGGHPDWNQAWRAPLRQALDWLRDKTTTGYEEKAGQFLKDPWAARDDYIKVVLDRSPDNISQFLDQHATRTLNEDERVVVMKLLELQRYAMQMYASDAWFFDELSGVETVQVIQYAGRVIQLASEFGVDVESGFLEIMQQAKSNLAEQGDGRGIYERMIKPAKIDLSTVAAHYAVSSLFEESFTSEEQQAEIYCYQIEVDDYQSQEAGLARLALGQVKVTSKITLESAVFNFGVLYLGASTLNAGIKEFQNKTDYENVVREITAVFLKGDFSDVIRLFDQHFGTSAYTLKSLFRDERSHILDHILESTLLEVEATYRQIYHHHSPLMLSLADLGGSLPKAFHSAAEFILNSDLRRAIGEDSIDIRRIRELLEMSRIWKIELDKEELSYLFQQALEKMMAGQVANPGDLSHLEGIIAAVELGRSLPFTIDLWLVQNRYYQMLKSVYPEFRERVEQGDESAQKWVEQFVALGDKISIRVTL